MPTTCAVTCALFGASSNVPSPPSISTSGWKVLPSSVAQAVDEQALALADAVLLAAE